MTEYNTIKCTQCKWVMSIPLENKMTKLENALQIHMNQKHKN